jgi:hypothetical protein
MSTLLVVLVLLATYRITRLLVADEFPPIRAPREWISDRWPNSSVAYLVNCPWCTGAYVAAGIVAGVDWWTDHPVLTPALLIAAASGVAGLIAAVEPD